MEVLNKPPPVERAIRPNPLPIAPRLNRFRADPGPVQSRAASVVSTEELYVMLEGADLSTEENVRHALQAVLAHVWRIEQRQTNVSLRQRISDV